MKKSIEIRSKIDVIKELLINDATLRDNDRALVAAFWKYENPTLCTFGTAGSLLRSLSSRALTDPEVITRTRRKVQALNPELCGHVKDSRAEAEIDVRLNINKLGDVRQ